MVPQTGVPAVTLVRIAPIHSRFLRKTLTSCAGALDVGHPHSFKLSHSIPQYEYSIVYFVILIYKASLPF